KKPGELTGLITGRQLFFCLGAAIASRWSAQRFTSFAECTSTGGALSLDRSKIFRELDTGHVRNFLERRQALEKVGDKVGCGRAVSITARVPDRNLVDLE